jgi:hypothetical protein
MIVTQAGKGEASSKFASGSRIEVSAAVLTVSKTTGDAADVDWNLLAGRSRAIRARSGRETRGLVMEEGVRGVRSCLKA